MEGVKLNVEDLKQWVQEKQVPFAHKVGNGIDKKLLVTFDKRFIVEVNGKTVVNTPSAKHAVRIYNEH